MHCWVLGAALMVLWFPMSVFAASLPATRDIVVQPGEVSSVEIPIVNTGATDKEFSLLLFSASFQPGVEQPQLQNLSSDMASWVALPDSSVFVSPGASVPIVLTIQPPSTTTPQALTLAVVAAEKLPGEISLVHGAATLVFVTIGDVTPHGSCVLFAQTASGTANLSLTNDGQGILYDNGTIVLRGMFGFRFGTSSSNPLFHRVSSGQTRTWSVSLPAVPWWAIGPLSYHIDDTQLGERSCDDIDVGVRWWPLIALGLAIFGGVGFFVRRRIS